MELRWVAFSCFNFFRQRLSNNTFKSKKPWQCALLLWVIATILNNLQLRPFLFWKKEIPWEWGGILKLSEVHSLYLKVAAKPSLANRAFLRKARRTNAAIFMDQRLFLATSLPNRVFSTWMDAFFSLDALRVVVFRFDVPFFARSTTSQGLFLHRLTTFFGDERIELCFFHVYGRLFPTGCISSCLFPSWSTTVFSRGARRVIVFFPRKSSFSS